MNHMPLQQTELDRLVDDELDEAARRHLLQQIEATNAWRQVAITFLEAQAIQRGLRELCFTATARSETSNVNAVAQPTLSAPLHGTLPNRRRYRVMFVAALTLLAAVATGSWIRSWLRLSPNTDVASYSNQTGRLPTYIQVDKTNPEADELPASLQLVVNDGQSDVPRVIDLPIESEPDLMDSWEPRAALPDDLYQWLNASGHEVEEASSLVPVTLPNGRQVVFPVNQVRVNYRGPKWHQ
jgi:hypothetical protein